MVIHGGGTKRLSTGEDSRQTTIQEPTTIIRPYYEEKAVTTTKEKEKKNLKIYIYTDIYDFSLSILHLTSNKTN